MGNFHRVPTHVSNQNIDFNIGGAGEMYFLMYNNSV